MSAAFTLSSLKPPGVPARANKRPPAVDADEDVESGPILTPRKEGQQPIHAAIISSERLCSCTLPGATHQHLPATVQEAYAVQRGLPTYARSNVCHSNTL